MKELRGKVKQSVDRNPLNSSNPYAEFLASIESSSKTKPSSSSSPSSPRKAKSGAPNTSSHSPDADPIPGISMLKGKNSQDSLDLVSVRNVYELCKTAEQKSAFKAIIQPIILSRLEKLSEMEQETGVGDEIADAVDFLKTLNPSDPRFVEIGKISQMSRKGSSSLQKGMTQLKGAQGQLLSRLRALSPNDHNDDDDDEDEEKGEDH